MEQLAAAMELRLQAQEEKMAALAREAQAALAREGVCLRLWLCVCVSGWLRARVPAARVAAWPRGSASLRVSVSQGWSGVDVGKNGNKIEKESRAKKNKEEVREWRKAQ
eukprot:6184698-Pleurochrysis_carterae.AAC.1